MARQDSNLQPDRYEREDFPTFSSVIDRLRCVFLGRFWCETGAARLRSNLHLKSTLRPAACQFHLLDPLTTNFGGPDVRIVPGAPDTIRTCGLHLRRVALYPAELRVHLLLTQCLRGFLASVKW